MIRSHLNPSVALAFALAALIHCSLFRPYRIIARTDALFPPTNTVVVIWERPERDYVVLAEFAGREPAACPEGMELCVLRRKARAMGAHAIWIRKHIFRRIPGDWVYTNGRLIRIYPATYDTWLGVLIRFREQSQ